MNYKAYEAEVSFLQEELADGKVSIKEYNEKLRDIESEIED